MNGSDRQCMLPLGYSCQMYVYVGGGVGHETRKKIVKGGKCLHESRKNKIEYMCHESGRGFLERERLDEEEQVDEKE